MPVNTPEITFDPYKPQVPIPMMAPVDTQPTGSSGPLPLQAGFMGKAGSVADIVNEGFRGFMRGHEQLAQRKAQQANYALDLAQTNESNAWKTYEDALGTGKAKPGDKNDPAYMAYLAAHTATDDVMKKIAIPGDKPKGQKGQKKKTDGSTTDSTKPQGFADKFRDFMQANPHLIPQALITARVPRPPNMTASAQETQNRIAMQGQDIKLNEQNIASNTQNYDEKAREIQVAKENQAVEEAGGVEKVRNDPNATPQMKQAADRMFFSVLDPLGPDGQRKYQYDQDLKTGAYKNWTPGDWMRAGKLGVVQEPQPKIIEKGSKEYQVLINPATNQPVPGSVPLYIGPSSEAKAVAVYFARRNAERNDLKKAVTENPEAFGWTPTGNEARDKATIDAITDKVFIANEEGISAYVGLTGKPAMVAQQEFAIASDIWKSALKQIPGKEGSSTDFYFPGEKEPRSLTKEQVQDILGQFMTEPTGVEHPGIYTLRDTPKFMPGKDAATLERERQWAYQYAKNTMLAEKGKDKGGWTEQSANNFLSQTALGKPITAQDVPEPPKQQDGNGWWMHEMMPWRDWGKGTTNGQGNAMQGPPNGNQGAPAGAKVFIVNGQYVQMTDAEAQKVKDAGYPVQEAPANIRQQFNQ